MLVKVFKDGSVMRLASRSQKALNLIRKTLAYTRVKHLVTKADKDIHGSHVAFTVIDCFRDIRVKDQTHVITNTGFLPRLTEELERKGYDVHVKDMSPVINQELFRPRWDRVGDDFRYKQRETLEALAGVDRGRVWWATGAGKTWLIPKLCMLFPKCRIVVTTKFLPVLEDTIYARLLHVLPSVGIYHSKKKKPGRRVMCWSGWVSRRHQPPRYC